MHNFDNILERCEEIRKESVLRSGCLEYLHKMLDATTWRSVELAAKNKFTLRDIVDPIVQHRRHQRATPIGLESLA